MDWRDSPKAGSGSSRSDWGEPGEGPIDRYVVLEYLAEGGMGAIYLGKKMGAGGFEKEVVLKQLLPEFTQQQEFIDLFLREARLSRHARPRQHHPHDRSRHRRARTTSS